MKKKIALVHHHFINMRGGERVVVELKKIFPEADVFSLMYDKKTMPKMFRKWNIRTTFLQKIPGFSRIYQNLLPLYPFAVEHIDVSEYDIVISTDSFVSKGVITGPESTHICYCFTPMRFIWDQYFGYSQRFSGIKKIVFSITAHYMRLWDYAASARVDHFIADSRFVAQRIKKYYRRNASVVNAPVDCSRFDVSDDPKSFFLVLSALVSYKKADLAVKACTKLGLPLVVAGTGEQLPYLKQIAGPTVTFEGNVSDQRAAALFSQCRALIFSGVEDYGIVPLEAMASGRPVIAYGKGGVCDTVINGETGVFFYEQTVDALCDVLDDFNEDSFDPQSIKAHAHTFDNSVFREKMKVEIQKAIENQ